MAKVLDSSFEVNELKLQLYYYIHFWTNTFGKSINFLISSAIKEVVILLFFNKDIFDIK